MEAVKRVFKFQFLSFNKNFLVTLLISFAITLVGFLINFFVNQENALQLTAYDWFLGALMLASLWVFFLICVHMFITLYFEDYSLSVRFGSTRKSFILSNLLFLLVEILIYSLIFSIVIYLVFRYFVSGDFYNQFKELVLSEMTSEELDLYNMHVNSSLGFSEIFLNMVSAMLQIIGFTSLVGVLIFTLRGKSIIIFGFVIFLSSFDSYIYTLTGININLSLGLLGSILFFLISQAIAAFCLYKIDRV